MTSTIQTALSRGLTAFLVTVLLVPMGTARAAPGDIFTLAAPVIGADPPKATELAAGDVSVATATGAVSYSYPIGVPPGRNGMAPRLALNYSSQAPTYGGIAAGWSLPIGMIREDTSSGRLATHDPFIEATQLDRGYDDRFVSSIAGESALVAVDEPKLGDVYRTYRVAHGDATFARYERLHAEQPARWRVRTSDGMTMLFGELANAPCPTVNDGFAPLTRTIDSFGNEVRYQYHFSSGECMLDKITWGQNAAAGLAAFAEVEVNYDQASSCNGIRIGSQISYRDGQKVVTGANQILSITARAFEPGSQTVVHTRQINLTYAGTSCTAQHAPLRFLRSIQETAWGTDSPMVTAPAVTFEYGDPIVNLNTQRTQPNEFVAPDAHPHNLAWGYRRPKEDDRWPTVEAMMLDVDGDGLVDRVKNISTPGSNGQCKATWLKNYGVDPVTQELDFAPPPSAVATITLPRLKWNANGTIAGGNEGCALNGQFTTFKNSHEELNVCHDASSNPCVASSNPDNPNTYCGPNGTKCPLDEGAGHTPYFTYLAYRWLDMDSDGLVDLAAAVHGDIDHYDIEMGNDVGFRGVAEPNLFGPWPACPGSADRCTALNTHCATEWCPAGQSCNADPGQVNECTADAPVTGCNDLISVWGSPVPPPTPPSSGSAIRTPYTRCEGLYPWFIYKNTGNGVFATTPIIKYQPVPLESDQGDSSFTGPSFASQHHGILDFDGDGRLDAVVHPRGWESQDTDVWWWFVFLGDGTGGFGPRHIFQTRTDGLVSSAGLVGSPDSTMGLLDINGDGLLDHWQMRADGGANVAFHYGTRHAKIGVTNGPAVGELNTPANIRPANEAVATVTNPTPYTGQPIVAGNTRSANRVVDVDGDGRQDIVKLPSQGVPQVHFNVGGQFSATSVTFPGDISGLDRLTTASQQEALLWELSSDLIDLDGDGIPESTRFSPPSMHRGVPSNVDPPRLLREVKNGRGLTTAITYASMHEKVAVEQNPHLSWFDGRPKASPNTQWVVKSMRATDQFAATQTDTSYFYRNPRHGADHDGRFAFRGFEEVITTSENGAKTVERYTYDVDWSGRLAETHVVPAEAPGEVRSITKQHHQAHPLFGGSVRAILPSLSESFTCANDQTVATCTPAAAAAYTRTTTTHQVVTAKSGHDLLYVEVVSQLEGPVAADGDRRTDSTFVLHADAATYRLRRLSTQRSQRAGANWIGFAKTATTWDPTCRVALTEEVWFDDVDANRAITRSGYDMSTGNLVERWKPEQDSGPKTAFHYDARKLFVDLELNELGHQVEYVYEYGTGTKLETLGPNTAGATKERHKIRVDGFGRTIEDHESISLTGSSYSNVVLVGTTTHVEANFTANPAVPASFTSSRRIDANGTGWTQEKTEIDGHGRPIKKTVFVQGSAPENHVTTFSYRNDGTLQLVTVPDPSANNASTVQYAYAFDSLGRPTSIRRPDAPINKSGVDITYDGVTKTVTEVVGDAGGQVAATKTINDRFGRLTEVHEKTGDSPATWAVTHYTYGPDDLVATIVDPQGVTTSLTHDFGGRRTQIARHGRVWKYGYDKNGNMTSEQVPGSAGPLTDPDFTTTIDYDALDRATSRVIGQRVLSLADQQAFGARTETLTYDAAPNAKGLLVSWQTFAPSASTATSSETLSYDSRGNRTNVAQTFDGAEYTNLQRSFYREWNLLAAPTLTEYRDHLGPHYKTSSNHHYDLRGLPQRIDLFRTGEPTLQIANQARNVAGLVTTRGTTLTGPMTSIGSSWTYDKLGRVLDQHVKATIGATKPTIARQQLAYFGNDDPSTLTHSLGSNAKIFQFGYDKRHQLTSANETTTAGYFTSSYQYGTAGRLANVNIAQPTPPAGSELKPRHVDYQYSDPDPERITALLHAGSSTRYATYQYDEAGNQISRCYGPTHTPTCTGESMDFIYDGNDQLRRAIKKLNGIVVGSEEYFYNSGQRFAVVERDANGTKSELTWFIGDTEAHYDGTGTVNHVYSHLSLGTPVARIDRTAQTTTSLEFQFHGLASSTLASVATSGATNAAFYYSPFGEVLEAFGTGAAQRRRFNDKQADNNTGFAYYGLRYFDHHLIGWTQADPVYRYEPDRGWESPRRANLYTFSLNNALRYLDPDGADNKTIHVEIALKALAAERTKECAQARAPARNGEATSGNGPLKALSFAWTVADGIWEATNADNDLSPASDCETDEYAAESALQDFHFDVGRSRIGQDRIGAGKRRPDSEKRAQERIPEESGNRLNPDKGGHRARSEELDKRSGRSHGRHWKEKEREDKANSARDRKEQREREQRGRPSKKEDRSKRKRPEPSDDEDPNKPK